MQEQLKEYVSSGMKIFPVKGKIPLTRSGFKDATADLKVIEQWTASHSEAGWAIACGAASGITVIDIDKKSGGLDSLEFLLKRVIDELGYVIATPGGGLHLYFSYDPSIKTTTGILPGVDIRNEGSYVVAPPSPGYRIISDDSVLEPMPEELKTLLLAIKRPTGNEQPLAEGEALNIGEGGRNAYLTRLGGSLRKYALSEAALYEALAKANEEQCTPPLPDSEVRSIARSVSRYAPAPPEMEEKKRWDDDVEDVRIVSAGELIEPMLSYLNDKDLVKGDPTGVMGLDALLGGGRRLGELTAWHAEAKTGKNTLWHYMMWLKLKQGVPLGYASRELSPENEVMPNLLSLELMKNAWKEDVTREEASVASCWPLYFASGYGSLSWERMKEWITLTHETYGVKYFFIDHLHYCLEEPEDHKEASKLAKRLKQLTKELNIHIDLIIQPNKLMEGQRLSLNSIKGGAAIGQAIDNLITLKRLPAPNNSVMEVKLDVGRSKLCQLGAIFLQYDRNLTTFLEVEVTETEERIN